MFSRKLEVWGGTRKNLDSAAHVIFLGLKFDRLLFFGLLKIRVIFWRFKNKHYFFWFNKKFGLFFGLLQNKNS